MTENDVSVSFSSDFWSVVGVKNKHPLFFSCSAQTLQHIQKKHKFVYPTNSTCTKKNRFYHVFGKYTIKRKLKIKKKNVLSEHLIFDSFSFIEQNIENIYR